ncbi:MAG: hypothetical protein KU37_03360 [Sulfuricurvum sp. PC08-66]|nr:MAG: hypothetical protein KU37_03360 [Sulfuricurvum sp. PC08-66]
MPLDASSSSHSMPALFVGHGSPMNAIQTNPFVTSMRALGESLPKPQAILVISAHWMPPFHGVSLHESREVMYDFFGFPEEMYALQYPAPSAPQLIDPLQKLMGALTVKNRALDHGAWTVLMHLFPDASIPVMQWGIPRDASMRQHFAFGRALGALRDQGVMIIGSGNITHNLGAVDRAIDAPPREWAVAFDSYIREALLARDWEALIEAPDRAPYATQAHPTWEHYIPLLYIAGAMRPSDEGRFPYEGIHHGTLSMRNWVVGMG